MNSHPINTQREQLSRYLTYQHTVNAPRAMTRAVSVLSSEEGHVKETEIGENFRISLSVELSEFSRSLQTNKRQLNTSEIHYSLFIIEL